MDVATAGDEGADYLWMFELSGKMERRGVPVARRIDTCVAFEE